MPRCSGWHQTAAEHTGQGVLGQRPSPEVTLSHLQGSCILLPHCTICSATSLGQEQVGSDTSLNTPGHQSKKGLAGPAPGLQTAALWTQQHAAEPLHPCSCIQTSPARGASPTCKRIQTAPFLQLQCPGQSHQDRDNLQTNSEGSSQESLEVLCPLLLSPAGLPPW